MCSNPFIASKIHQSIFEQKSRNSKREFVPDKKERKRNNFRAKVIYSCFYKFDRGIKSFQNLNNIEGFENQPK